MCEDVGWLPRGIGARADGLCGRRTVGGRRRIGSLLCGELVNYLSLRAAEAVEAVGAVEEVEEVWLLGSSSAAVAAAEACRRASRGPGTAGKRAESADETRQERLGGTYSRVYRTAAWSLRLEA